MTKVGDYNALSSEKVGMTSGDPRINDITEAV